MGLNYEGLVKCVLFFAKLKLYYTDKAEDWFCIYKDFYKPVTESLRGLQSIYTYQEVVQCPCTQGWCRTT